ncbi:MAG: reprolysin-like metallopeptidase [Bacteroidota bacterium]
MWSNITNTDLKSPQSERQIIPDKCQLLQLNFVQIKALLASAPTETDFINGVEGVQLEIPEPDGRFQRYEVWEAPVMAPELGAQYPDIKSYAGRSIDSKGDYLRFDVTPGGFHAMTLTLERGTLFIDPYARGNTEQYICYAKKDFRAPASKEFPCLSFATNGPKVTGTWAEDRVGTCGNLRTYRLALAATGEYTAFFGGTVAGALAAMNTTMTRVNGVYERDFSVRMTIIGNNSNIIYTNAATDPYTNDDGTAMLAQNQSTVDGVIGSANYDIGHVFSTGGGGIAYVGVVCVAGYKAQGVTGSPAPVGDPFDIDYVAHEMGHQWGTGHTQYNDCNRDNATAVEPGSASTIMGYAGICPPDIQAHSDDYFSAASMAEIAAFIATTSCYSSSSNGNSAPTCAALTNKSIPISTPFVLTASGSDPNGDAITYCWEQMDAYTAPAQPMPPASTNTTGPMFRSLSPTTSPSRYFPNFSDVYGNVNGDWEELPSIGRALNFRVTVRDNRSGGGCSTEKNVVITTVAAAGPFVVTQPNSFVSWPANSTQTVTWNVANTTASPVSCSNVDILITTNSGATFSTLVSNTSNDGSQSVIIPNTPAPKARIMVRAVNNVFYDISDIDFTITAALPVELTAFNAVYANKKVRLNWQTANETQNLGFEIERSTGDATHFESISWVAAEGIAHRYETEDLDVFPSQVYYYRLHQTDADGRGWYSGIQVVKTGSSAQLAVYPNPASNSIRITAPDLEPDTELFVRIWDAMGRLARKQAYKQGQAIEVADLPGGVYRVEVEMDGRVLRGGFVR